MGRILIMLLIALGLGLYFPQSRDVILEVARPLATPAYRWMTSQELRQIVDDLEALQGSGAALPARRGEFDIWMERRYPQEGSRRDAWQNRYRLDITPTGFQVRSAGPDGMFDTEDDVVREGGRNPAQPLR